MGLDSLPVESTNALGRAWACLDSVTEQEWLDSVPQAAELSQLWSEGNFDEGLRLSEQRLAKNPDDLLGLFVRLDHARVYRDRQRWAESALRILAIVKKIDTKNFSQALPLFLMEMKKSNELWRSYTESPLRTPSHERDLFGPLYYVGMLERDGLIPQMQ